MSIIIAIGGGEIRTGETFEIDSYIVEKCSKKSPHHLFIPTASGEPEGYIQTVQEVYGKKLGCNCDVLCLKDRNIDDCEIETKIKMADIIYVGGGDTKMMLDIWRKYGIQDLLVKASQKGTILSGLSAGSVCWFEYGVSDTESFGNTDGWNYSYINGLGLMRGCHSPHLNAREQEGKFIEFMKTHDKKVLGIEDNCALVLENNRYQIIRSDKSKNAYIVYGNNGKIEKEKVSENGDMDRIFC